MAKERKRPSKPLRRARVRIKGKPADANLTHLGWGWVRVWIDANKGNSIVEITKLDEEEAA